MGTNVDGDALDQLEAEDKELSRIFEELDAHRGSSVEERAEYGNLVKQLIRHVAVREAALVDVVLALKDAPSLRPVGERMERHTEQRRSLIDRVEAMSRGVQGMNLNTGQDLDSELRALEEVLRAKMQWELTEAVPAVRRALPQDESVGDLHSADHIVRHAPTNLSPRRPKWYERAPIVSRALALYDHLRDFPKAARSD